MLTDKRVLITGGAGLIGSHITDALLAAGVPEIILFDDLSRGRRANVANALASGRVRLIEGDVRNPSEVAAAMAGVSLVFHQAAIRITHCAKEPRLAKDVLIDGTYNVVEAAQAAGVRKIVAASTASVYGLAESFPTEESHHPYANRTIYGAAKVFNEGLLRSFNDMYGLNYVALRYFNVYGPRMDVHGVYTEVLIRWMENIAAGKPPVIFGDGTQTMDFVHVRDIARANLLAAEAPVSDMVFNVASGVETSLLDLAHALARAMDSTVTPTHVEERKVNAVSRRLASTAAAAKHLGFKAEIGLDEGLRDLVEWWRAEARSGGASAPPDRATRTPAERRG